MQTKVVLSLALATVLIQAQTFASDAADNSVSAINAEASVAPILNDIIDQNAPELSSEEKLKASVYEDDDEHEGDSQNDDEHGGDGQSDNDEHEGNGQTEDDNEEKEDGGNDNDKADVKRIFASIKKNSYPPKAFKIYKLNEEVEASRINKKAIKIDKRREGAFDDYRNRDRFDRYKKKKSKTDKGYDRNKKEKEDTYEEVNEVEKEVNKEFNEAINEAFNEENNRSTNESSNENINGRINEEVNEEANKEANEGVNEEVNEEANEGTNEEDDEEDDEEFDREKRKQRKEDEDAKEKEDDDIRKEDDKYDDIEASEKENDDEKKIEDEDEKEKDGSDSDDDDYVKSRHTDDNDDEKEDEDAGYSDRGGYHHDSYENKKGSKESKDHGFAKQDAQASSDVASVGSAPSAFAMSDSSPSVSSGYPMSFVGSPSAPLANATPTGAGTSKATNNIKAKPAKSSASLMRVSLSVTIGISLIAVSILF